MRRDEPAPSGPSWQRLRKTGRGRQRAHSIVVEKDQERFGANLRSDARRFRRSRCRYGQAADQLMDAGRHRSVRENAHYSCAVVKALELPLRPCDLPVRVATDQRRIPDLLGDCSNFGREVIAAPQPRGNAVEEQGGFRAPFSNARNGGIRCPLSGFRGRLMRTLHDPNDGSDRNLCSAMNGAVIIDREGHAQRLARQNLKRDRSIGEHVGVVEDGGSLEASVVAGSPAEELIFSCRGDRQLVRQRVRITGESVR